MQRYVHFSKQHLAEAQKHMEEFRATLEIADVEQRTITRDTGGTDGKRVIQ